MKLGFQSNFHLDRKLVNLYTRFSLYVNLGVVAIFVLIGYVVLIGPKWQEISSVGLNDYKNEQQRLESDKEYLAELKTLVRKYNSLNQAEVAAIETIAPSGEQLPALFVQMEAMTKDAGMQLDSISFSTDDTDTVVSSSALKTLVINMQVSGGTSYADMKQLIDTIEKNQRLLDLVAISFSLTETEVVAVEGGIDEGAYSLVLRTYYLPEQSQTAAVPSELELILNNLNNQAQ